MEQGSKTSPWIGDTFFQKSENYVRAGADLTDVPFWSPGLAAECDSRESSGCAEPGPGGASQDQRGREQGVSPMGAQALTQGMESTSNVPDSVIQLVLLGTGTTGPHGVPISESSLPKRGLFLMVLCLWFWFGPSEFGVLSCTSHSSCPSRGFFSFLI